jgi:hypothetical protein
MDAVFQTDSIENSENTRDAGQLTAVRALFTWVARYNVVANST